MNLRSKARWWSVESVDNRSIGCHLCPKECVIKEGERGSCFVRKNEDGEMKLEGYGRGVSYRVDPIEKKPLYHFLPGTPVLSFGSMGCNLSCDYCLHSVDGVAEGLLNQSVEISPERVVEMAISCGCRSIAFTDNDPRRLGGVHD